mmetsp:Transcript_45606/g.145233  ORF Transcript_45606/g.145233 Transcript_45606/m.145233 type:complete len:100 (-) Transcript_45606:515-814(-)
MQMHANATAPNPTSPSCRVDEVFNVKLRVRALDAEGQRRVLSHVGAFCDADMEGAITMLGGEVAMKRLLMLVEMARQGGGGGADSIITLQRWAECLDMD